MPAKREKLTDHEATLIEAMPLTTQAAATATGLNHRQAYTMLFRLRSKGLVRRNGELWMLTKSGPDLSRVMTQRWDKNLKLGNPV